MLPVQDGQFTDREKLFGPDVPAALIRHVKSGLPGILDEAEIAEAGVTMTGETVLIAQFPGKGEAKRAAAAYHRGFQLRNTSGDEETGWRATRGLQGDFVEILRTGRQLFVWSGLTREAASARRAASNVAVQFPALAPAARPALFPALQPLGKIFEPLLIKVVGILFLVALYTVWFFKGSGWASSAQPVARAPLSSADELVPRLMSINELDVPFAITKGPRPNELTADWRYADAKWVDHARAHGMKRSFRIQLTLDESSHTVRATDYVAALDWSAGRGGASVDWKAGLGIVFFQKEQHRVFGLQLDEHGRFKQELSYSYRFDLDEMKSPVMSAVTRAGWKWRPTVWQGPRWLRWLTE